MTTPPRPRPPSRQPAANSSPPEERPRPSRASRRRTGSSSSSGTASRRSQLTAHRRLSRIFCHFAKSWRNSAASPSRRYPNKSSRQNQRPPSGRPSFYQAGFAGLYLQAEILGVDAALGETAGDKPEARLGGAHEHVAQFLVIAETPDRANAVRDITAEQFANQMFLAFEAGRQDDQICRE